MDIAEVRMKLGHAWGLERPLTRVELGRALGLTGEYVGRLEGGAKLAKTTEILIGAFLDGYRPRNMDDLVTPGYPRGVVT